MSERTQIEEIRRIVLEEAQTDTVGLWSVLWQVREEMPLLAETEAMHATLTVIRGALEGDQIVAGEFVDQDEETSVFVPWQLSVDESLSRIEREWTSLGRDPIPGEIVWFVDRGLLPVTARKHPMGKDWQPSR